MTGILADSWEAWGLRGKFVMFGPSHLAVMAIVLVALFFLSRVARDPSKSVLCYRLDVMLAIFVLWSYPAKILTRYYADVDMEVPSLPMFFCDWAAIAAFFALVFRSDRMAEITYFWGMAGTLQGLVTPNIDVGFPHPAWFAFFQLHGGVVLVGLYLVIGHRWRPKKGAVMRVWIYANAYLALAALVTLLSVHNNYAFVRSKPENGSLMDMLGPWPYYIFAMQALALLVFILFDLPFWRGRKRAAAEQS